MMQNIVPRSLIVLLLFCWICRTPAPAEDSLVDRSILEQRIEDELLSILHQVVDEQQYARLYGFEFPMTPPERSFDEVQRVVEQQLDRLVMVAYPDRWVEEQYARYAPRHRQWKVGERVQVGLADGSTYSETLRERNPTNVLIGPRRFDFQDLHPETLIHLDAQRGREARERMQRQLRQRLQALRFEHRQNLRLQQAAEIYKREGYIRVRGVWLSEYDFFRDSIREKRQAFEAFLRPSLEYKHYYNGGYRLHNGNWYHPNDPLLARLDGDTFDRADAGSGHESGSLSLGGVARRIIRMFGGGGDDDEPEADLDGRDRPAAAAAPGAKTTPKLVFWGLVVFGTIAGLAIIYAGIAAIRRRRRQ